MAGESGVAAALCPRSPNSRLVCQWYGQGVGEWRAVLGAMMENRGWRMAERSGRVASATPIRPSATFPQRMGEGRFFMDGFPRAAVAGAPLPWAIFGRPHGASGSGGWQAKAGSQLRSAPAVQIRAWPASGAGKERADEKLRMGAGSPKSKVQGPKLKGVRCSRRAWFAVGVGLAGRGRRAGSHGSTAGRMPAATPQRGVPAGGGRERRIFSRTV